MLCSHRLTVHCYIESSVQTEDSGCIFIVYYKLTFVYICWHISMVPVKSLTYIFSIVLCNWLIVCKIFLFVVSFLEVFTWTLFFGCSMYRSSLFAKSLACVMCVLNLFKSANKLLKHHDTWIYDFIWSWYVDDGLYFHFLVASVSSLIVLIAPNVLHLRTAHFICKH